MSRLQNFMRLMVANHSFQEVLIFLSLSVGRRGGGEERESVGGLLRHLGAARGGRGCVCGPTRLGVSLFVPECVWFSFVNKVL